jgi:hypothetical protein
MISPVWVVINSFSTLRRTSTAAQDNFLEIICERATVLTETPSVLNRKKLNHGWTPTCRDGREHGGGTQIHGLPQKNTRPQYLSPH